MFNFRDSEPTQKMPSLSAVPDLGDLPQVTQKRTRTAFGPNGMYRCYRRDLHVAMRSAGSWVMAAIVGVLTASISSANTVFGGFGSAAAATANTVGTAIQAAAAAGPDWGWLLALAESESPWLLTTIPATIWLIAVAVKE